MPNRKPIDFHNQVVFKQHDKNSTLSSCLCHFQILTNIDTSSLANTVIKKSNVLKFDINVMCESNMFTFQPNKYYCMIELRDPTNGTMLVTQDGNSLLSKETICSLTKLSETEFGAQLKVSINKGNRGTKGVFRIQLLDRDDSTNCVEWTTTESFLIQDRNSKKSTYSTKKRKCTDSDSEQNSDAKSSDEEIYAILKNIHPNIKKEEPILPKKKIKMVTIKSEFGVENVHPNIGSMPLACNSAFDYKFLQPPMDTCSREQQSDNKHTCSESSKSANIDDFSQLDFLLDFDNTLEPSTEEGFGSELLCNDSLSSFFNNFD